MGRDRTGIPFLGIKVHDHYTTAYFVYTVSGIRWWSCVRFKIDRVLPEVMESRIIESHQPSHIATAVQRSKWRLSSVWLLATQIPVVASTPMRFKKSSPSQDRKTTQHWYTFLTTTESWRPCSHPKPSWILASGIKLAPSLK